MTKRISKDTVEYINSAIYVYNMQSAVMNGTADGISEITEDISAEELAEVESMLGEYLK